MKKKDLRHIIYAALHDFCEIGKDGMGRKIHYIKAERFSDLITKLLNTLKIPDETD